MRYTHLLFPFVLLLISQLFIACAPTTVSQLTKKTDAKQLSAAEILLAAKNNTLFIQGSKVHTYLYFDGSGNVFGLDLYNNKDTGKWDVSGEGELCYKMNDWWLGKLSCFPVYHGNNKYYLFNSSGVLMFTADQSEGDSKNLYHETKKSKQSFLLAQSKENAAQEPSSPARTETESENSGNTLASDGPSQEELQSTVKWMARDCPDCNLAGTNLSGADLIGAKLHGANLSGANLRNANLRRADLQGADLTNADLSYANMPGANLRNSDLTNAVFKGANLIRANFTGAKTEGANFDGALVEGAEGLPQ